MEISLTQPGRQTIASCGDTNNLIIPLNFLDGFSEFIKQKPGPREAGRVM
jgi:hypothetical protein